MSPELDVVILAGGEGKRMGERAKNIQKCMIPIENKPIIAYILDNVSSSFDSSARVVIATGYKSESITEYLGSKYKNIDIEYVHSPEKLEYRKRLLLAEDHLRGPFIVHSGDVVTRDSHMRELAETFFHDMGVKGVVSGASEEFRAPTHALIITNESKLVQIIYPPPVDSSGKFRDMGIYFFDNTFLYKLKETAADILAVTPVINAALKEGEDFSVLKYFDKWYHFAEPADLDVKIEFDSH